MRRNTCLLLLTSMVLASSFARAAGPIPVEDRDPAPPLSTDAACTLAPAGFATISYIWTPPEELSTVAWKLPLGSCAACADSGGALSLSQASFRMRWLRACTAQVQLSIIGATPGDSCLVPDPSRVLYGPITRSITGSGNLSVTHAFTLPAGWCVSGDAFLLARFTGLGACASGGISPGLAAANTTCTDCEQYVTAFNIFQNTTEWCSVGATRPMWFSVTGDCCSLPTGAKTQSWGRLKQIYRR